MPQIAPAEPLTYRDVQQDPELRERYNVLARETLKDLQQQARDRHLRVRGTKTEVIYRLLGVAYVRPEPVIAPDFPMPAAEATRAELTTAIRDEATHYRDRMRAARNWAIQQYEGNYYCGGGLEEFLRTFGLPDRGSRAEVTSDLDRQFHADDFTDAGLRRYLERRIISHGRQYDAMMAYAISHRSQTRYTIQQMNRGLALIGRGPYVPGSLVSVSMSTSWQIPGSVVTLSALEQTAKARALRDRITAFVAALAEEGWVSSGPAAVSAVVAPEAVR